MDSDAIGSLLVRPARVVALAFVAFGCSESDGGPSDCVADASSDCGNGSVNSGGVTGNGGSMAGTGGGNPSTAGAGPGGSSATGGSGAGGDSATGGTPGSGGANAGSCDVSCSLPAEGTCASPRVRITEVDIGMPLVSVNEGDDREPIPLAIAPMPNGGSRLAWLSNYTRYGSSLDNVVHVAELDCNDALVGEPFSLEAYDFQDIAADENGGVIAVTRNAEGSGEQHCGDVDNLCRLPNDRPGCYDMYLARFDCGGTELWETKLTSSDAATPPYSAGDGRNYSIWWYQHHARIASDGTNHAVYFCDAITVPNGDCVDIHQGDRMQVVGPNGALVDHPDDFALGCSHSWNTRMVWDDRSQHFAMVCATDYPAPGQHQIARPAPYRTVWPSPGPDGSLSLGDLVPATGGGYWITASGGGTLHLLHFTEAPADEDIVMGDADFSHLVSYGEDQMIIAWASGSTITAQVRDAGDGSAVGPEFSIGVPDHRYQAFKSYPDGSVAFPARGTSDQTVRIARVMPCSG